jgi:hypothetical protein
MAQAVTLGGVGYSIPDVLDSEWGQNLTDYLVAIPDAVLQTDGGTFSLLNDVNFGGTAGLLSLYFKSRSANIASAGILRLANTDTIAFRNAGNDDNLLLGVDASDNLTFESTKILLSGDVVNADVAADAALARSKLASGTARAVVANDGSGVMGETDLRVTSGILTGATSISSTVFKSDTANGASAGSIRLANNESIAWRNAANTTDRTLKVDTGNGLVYSGASAGSEALIGVTHTDNTNAASGARMRTLVGGSSAGDPYFDCVVNGATSWGAGIDNSDSDAFVIANGAPGTNNALRFATGSAPDGSFYGNVLLRAAKELRLGDSDSTNYVALKSPAAVGTNYTITLPDTAPGDNTVLKHGTGGSYSWAAQSALGVVATQTANYTALNTDYLIPCDSSGGTFTVTLPAASGNSGLELFIKKIDSSFIAVTIEGDGSETIDGAANTTLNTQNEGIIVICDGANWQIVERRIPSIWTSYTPTCNLTTNATTTGLWKREGQNVRCQVKVAFSAGNSQATTCTFTIPNSSAWTIDTSALLNTATSHVLGYGACSDANGSAYDAFPAYNSTTTVILRLRDVASTYPTFTAVNTNGNIPFATAASDFFECEFLVPITGLNG